MTWKVIWLGFLHESFQTSPVFHKILRITVSILWPMQPRILQIWLIKVGSLGVMKLSSWRFFIFFCHLVNGESYGSYLHITSLGKKLWYKNVVWINFIRLHGEYNLEILGICVIAYLKAESMGSILLTFVMGNIT